MQSYPQQPYPFYGQPVNHFQSYGPYAPPGPSNAMPVSAQGYQYMPHPNYMVPSKQEGPSTAAPPPRMPRPRHLETNSFPKSAMKRAASTKADTVTRQRTLSNSHHESAPLTRQRTTSQSHKPFTSYHIFVTFRGSNQLVIENLMHSDALRELRQELYPIWRPGVVSDETQGRVWTVTFANNPWSSTGRDAISAWEIISKLFWLLAARGYTYTSSIHRRSSNPRLVFTMAEPDSRQEFLLAHFSGSGHRLSVINPSAVVIDSLADNLGTVIPHIFSPDHLNEEVLVIEQKRMNLRAPVTSAEKTQFITHVLKEMLDMGYILLTTIPMARRGVLGHKSRKEIWVFRGTKSTH